MTDKELRANVWKKALEDQKKKKEPKKGSPWFSKRASAVGKSFNDKDASRRRQALKNIARRK